MARMPVVVVLLLATLAITAWLSTQAQYGAGARQRIVRDWTRVAADELAARTANQIAFYGTYRILQILGDSATLPSAEDLKRAARTPIERRNAALAARTFRYDGTRRASAPAEIVSALDALLAHPPAPDEQKPIHAAGRVFAYTVSGDRRRIDGFEIDRAALAPFFTLALSMRPLLPRALAAGKIGNDAVRARVVDRSGHLLFATADPVAGPLVVRHRVDDDGVLQEATVEASLAPEVVGLIVAGGVPLQGWIYRVLLLIAGVLVVTAILQIGRERALARMRSDFVASVSHELRTPLTQIRMFAETLQLERVRSDEERKRSLDIIDRESRRLAQLVDNVLQFSRGERGMLRVAPRPADVGAIVRDAVQSFHERNCRITLSIGDGTEAMTDGDALRQVVLNLLDNAAKYGPAGQEILVEAHRAGGKVRISVDDEGPGVPPGHRRFIWRRYARLPRERERAIAGAGIGLAVVRDLLRLLGGKAWCESGTRGGARFVVEIPA